MSKVRAVVEIEKSFDKTSSFGKDWKSGDFKKFFEYEGEYIDRLCEVVEDNANECEGFTISYVVTVKKSK